MSNPTIEALENQIEALSATNKQLQQKVSQLEILRKTNLSLVSSLNLETVLTTILEATLQLLGNKKNNAHIFLYDNERLSFGAALYYDRRKLKPFAEIRSNGLTYTVARQGKPIIINNMSTHPLYQNTPTSWRGAIIGLPLKISDRIVGVMNVATTTPWQWTDDELNILFALADQAAIAIENARLYEQVHEELTRRKDAEESLREKEGLIQTMVSHLPIVLFAVNKDGIFTLSEGKGLESLGLKPGQVVGQSIFEVYKDIPRVINNAKRALSGEVIKSVGNVGGLTFESFYAPAFDAHGKSNGFFGIATDVTPYKLTQAELTQRINAMEALYETSLEINAQPDLATLLNTIVKRASKLLNTHGGGLFLLQPDGETLQMVAYFNRPPGASQLILKMGQGIAGRVAQSEQPLVVEDYDSWQGHAGDRPTVGQTGRILGVPLKQNNKVIGVLNVFDVKAGSFTPNDVRILSHFAAQAATAFHNISLFEQAQQEIKERELAQEEAKATSIQLEQHIEELSILNRISRMLATVTDLQTALQNVAQMMCQHFNAFSAVVGLLDEAKETLIVKARATLKPDTVNFIGREIRVIEGGATHKLLKTGKAVIISQAEQQKSTSLVHDLLIQSDLHAMLTTPLLARGEIIGSISLTTNMEGRQFMPEEAQLAETIATQITGAIENVRLFEQEQYQRQLVEKQVRELSILNSITQTTATVTDLHSVLQTVARQMVQLFDTRSCSILMLNEAVSAVTIVGHYFRESKKASLVGQTVVLTQNKAFNELIIDKKPLIISGSQSRLLLKGIQQIFQQGKIESIMAVPLLTRGKVIGLIYLDSTEPNRTFIEAELTLLQTIAGQVAGAVEISRLFEQEQAQHQLTEQALLETWFLYQTGRILAESANLQRGLEAVMKSYLDFLQLKQGGISLFDANLKSSKLYVLYSEGQLQPAGLTIDNFALAHQEIIKTKKPLIINYAPTDPLLADNLEWIENFNIQSMMLVPLLARGRVIGLVGADSTDRSYHFTERQISIAQSFADQIATLVENRRLLEQEQYQRRMAESLRQVAMALNSSLKPEDVLGRILAELRTIITFDSAGLFLQENDKLILSNGYNLDDHYFGFEIPISDNNVSATVFKSQKPTVINDIKMHPDWNALVADEQIKSWMAVPLLVGSKAIGVLTVDSFKLNTFTSDDVQIIQTFANQAAMAFNNARLFQEVQKAKVVAETANQAKSTFLANMSHELRTPLNVILGFTQLMSQEVDLPLEQQEQLRIILHSGEHLLDLINDILDLSKIEAGQASINKSNFNLRRLLNDLEQMFQQRAIADELQLFFIVEPDVPLYIRTDQLKLRQILINLLNNAFKFTKVGGISLLVRRQPKPANQTDLNKAESLCETIVFNINDTGPGISKEELDRLFEIFVQTQAGLQAQEGTGLGLAISHRFAQMLRGSLTVESEVGYGSIFSFDIEVEVIEASDLPEEESPQKIIGLAPNQPEYRILVVDDEWANRQLLLKLLQPLGFNLREASNGQEALAIWEAWNPHFIWMDLRMPVMDGYEATRRIKANQKRDTVVVAITASTLASDKNTILSLGCDDLIRKPFRPSDIFDMMHKHIGVSYLYENDYLRSEATATDQLKMIEITPELLASFSPQWRADFAQALIHIDIEWANSLIAQIKDENPELAHTLSQHLANFEYQRLIDRIEQVENA